MFEGTLPDNPSGLQPPPEPPHEDMKKWSDRFYGNRVFTSYFDPDLSTIPKDAEGFSNWVMNAIDDITTKKETDAEKQMEKEAIFELDGANVRRVLLERYTQSLLHYHNSEQAGNERSAIEWAARGEALRDLASDMVFMMGQDCTFIRDLFARTVGFNQEKYTQRVNAWRTDRSRETP